MKVLTLISMLHEPADTNSARRLFRGRPVLAWTLDRLMRGDRRRAITLLCWRDQQAAARSLVAGRAAVCDKGARLIPEAMEAVTAASRWRDGWRGGLLGTCEFDLGFHAPWVKELKDERGVDAVVLVDPAAGLMDAALLDRLIDHAGANESVELCFLPAAPGFSAALIKSAMVDRLAAAGAHPGRLLHYMPELPLREPLGGDGCVPVPTAVARTTARFKLDSIRQIGRIEHATESLNGGLIEADAESLIAPLASRPIDAAPRDVTVELTTERHTRPLYWAGRYSSISRPPLTRTLANRIWADLAASADDVRLTFGGVGDPLAHLQFADFVRDAARAGIRAIHVETDLRELNEQILTVLLEGAVDVISVALPALSETTYAAVMGTGPMSRVLGNIRDLLVGRQACRRGVPLIVPTFVRSAANAAEMDGWYDQWLRTLGSAVVRSPSDCGGLVPDIGGVDVTPPRRAACRRLDSRMMVLCDGTVPVCDEDVTAKHTIGRIDELPITEMWRKQLQPVRDAHRDGRWADLTVCGQCRQWHRP